MVFIADLLVAQPHRDIPVTVEHPPDVDVIVLLDVKDQVGEALERPHAQPRQIQLVCIARRARLWMPANVVVGLLQPLNESQGHLIARLLEVVIDRVLSIPAREFAGNDRFGFQTEPLF